MKTLYESIKSNIGIGMEAVIRDWISKYVLNKFEYTIEMHDNKYRAILTHKTFAYGAAIIIEADGFSNYPKSFEGIYETTRDGKLIGSPIIVSNGRNKDIDLSDYTQYGDLPFWKNAVIFKNCMNCKITGLPKHDKLKEGYSVLIYTGCSKTTMEIDDEDARLNFENGLTLNNCKVKNVVVNKSALEPAGTLRRDTKLVYNYSSSERCYIFTKNASEILDNLNDKNDIEEILYAGGAFDSPKIINGAFACKKTKLKSGETAWILKSC